MKADPRPANELSCTRGGVCRRASDGLFMGKRVTEIVGIDIESQTIASHRKVQLPEGFDGKCLQYAALPDRHNA